MSESDMARNNLAYENSLYLRQHRDNPVHWQPWGPEAFAEAERRGVPVIVSIGYSSCHWCHVMEHESFEDDYIAGLMNRHYVCIKVDREERPDVDHIYMEAVQMITGRGRLAAQRFLLCRQAAFLWRHLLSARGLWAWPRSLATANHAHFRLLPEKSWRVRGKRREHR